MRCLICDHTEWKNVDEYRLRPEGMSACTNCGFVSYPAKHQSKEQLLEHYRKDYRQGPPTVANIFTGQRKLHYHNEFLIPIFEEWKKGNKADPTICDVGAAFGMVLEMFKRNIPKSKLYGTELTETYRRVAWNEYGIELTEEFDDTVKYDLIISYKSAEHILDVDKEIRKWMTSLNEGGYLYIGVPIWFGTLHNFGVGGFDIEYYYHPNHVNVWDEKTFRTLLKKCGAEIVSENHTFYDSVFLCKRNDSLMDEKPELGTLAETENRLGAIKGASDAYLAQAFDLAKSLWKNFPIAHMHSYESKRAEWHKHGFEGIKTGVIDVVMADCPASPDMLVFCGDLAMRYSQWDIAIGFLNEAVALRPKDTAALEKIVICLGQLGDQETDRDRQNNIWLNARKLAQFIAGTSMQFRDMGVNMSLAYSAKLPLKDGS